MSFGFHLKVFIFALIMQGKASLKKGLFLSIIFQQALWIETLTYNWG